VWFGEVLGRLPSPPRWQGGRRLLADVLYEAEGVGVV